MRCPDVRRTLDTYLDEELTPLELSRVQGHLDDCEGCRAAVACAASLHEALTADAMTDSPPDALRQRILDRVRLEAGVTGATRAPAPRAARERSRLAVAAALLLGAVALAVALSTPGNPTASRFVPLHRELVEPAAPLSDVGLDLRGWLAHHLGASISVPSLTPDGERMSGGRAIVIDRRPAVQLLYEGGGRRLSLFILAGTLSRERGESEHTVEQVDVYTSEAGGSRIGWWNDGDHVFVAVGAVDGSDLLEFAALCIRSRRPPAPAARVTVAPSSVLADLGAR
jgi:anti-sigma factor RsiW